MKIVSILFAFISLLNNVKSLSDNKIYSQFYLSKYDFASMSENSIEIKVTRSSNLLFIASGSGGVTILESPTSQNIFQKMMNGQNIITVECSGDGTYFVASSSQGNVYGFSFNRVQLSATMLFDYPFSNSNFLKGMIKSSDESYLYGITGNGNIIVIDFKQRQKFSILTSLSTGFSYSMVQVLLSKSNKYIYVGAGLNGSCVFQYNATFNQITYLSNSTTDYVTGACIGTKDDHYIYLIDNWGGFFVTDFSDVLTANPSQYPIAMTFKSVWPFQDIDPTCFTLALSQEEDIIFVGVRSQGILAFDITDKLNPVFYYQIKVMSLSFQITFSTDYQYLYYSNYYSIYIFQLTELNLNDQIPNIFNSVQFVEKRDASIYKWSCNLVENDKYFFGSFSANGLYISAYNENPYQLNLSTAKNYDFISQSISFYPGTTIFYVPFLYSDQIVFQAYDYSTLEDQTINDITLKLTFKYPNGFSKSAFEFLYFNKDHTFCLVTTLTGFLLYQFNGPLQIIYLSSYTLPSNELSGQTTGAIFTINNKYVLFSIRYYGLSVVRISSAYTFLEVGFLKTQGGERLLASNLSDDYCFFIDGINGFSIIDLTALPQIKILSSISLIGWSNNIIPMFSDTYAFVQQRENGMISIIDMTDKSKLSLYSTYQRGNHQATSACMSKDQKYSFVMNRKYVLIFPLQSEVMLHTICQEITIINGESRFVRTIKAGEVLQVGQILQYNFLILYPQSEEVKISQITLYKSYQEESLPSWMSYNQVSQTLTMTVNKSGLGTDITLPNQMILLVFTLNPLNSNSFYFPSGQGKTTQNQSSQIYNYLKQNNLIDAKNQASQLFDPNLELVINLPGMNSYIINNVIQAMVQSTWVNQIPFSIQNSLYFNVTTSQIQTRSSTVSVLFSVVKGSGQFVSKSYPGVVISFSQEKDQLKLEGSLASINSVFSSKILYYSELSTENNNITLTISDDINYQLSIQQQIQNCSFIINKSQIQISKENNLQNQISAKYSNSVLDIETDYSISFLQNTFYVNDTQTMTYSFYLKQGNNSYSSIDPTYWFQPLSSSGLTLYGQTKYYQLWESITIQIVASDGYTSTSDEFTIHISGIPLLYVVNILFKIVGPIVAVLGLYNYRSYIINIFVAEKHTFSSETTISEHRYCKKIPLIGTKWKESKLLIQTLFTVILQSNHQKGKKKIEKFNFNLKSFSFNKKLQKNINKYTQFETNSGQSSLQKRYLSENGDINTDQLFEDINSKKQELILKNKSLASYLKQITQAFQKGSLIHESIKSYATHAFLQQDKKSNYLFQMLKWYLLNQKNHTKNDWYLQIIDIDHTFQEAYAHSPFPHITINEKAFKEILLELSVQNITQCSRTVVSPVEQGMKNIEEQSALININLIKNSIIYEAMGLNFDSLEKYQYFSGESIHLKSHEIIKVEAFKRAQPSIFYKLKQLLGLDYVPYGVQQNMKLPDWLQLKFKHGYIKLQGTPLAEEEDQTLIRIYDLNHTIVKQFFITVVPFNLKTEVIVPEERELPNGLELKESSIEKDDTLNSFKQSKYMNNIHFDTMTPLQRYVTNPLKFQFNSMSKTSIQ